MNDHTPMTDLPELSEERIAKIEDAVFAEISEHGASARTRPASARTRRRRWLTGLGVAAAFAAGILIAPPILDVVGNSGGSMSAGDSARVTAVTEAAPDMSTADSAAMDVSPAREIIRTAQATLRVKNIEDASDAIAAIAEEHGGYVESTELRAAQMVDGAVADAPEAEGYGWISIRVPSADLTVIIDELGSTGTVLASSVSQQDVTSAAIDLRARVETTRASVQRLTELMANTASVGELIEAESALAERQAQLESYEQQLAALDDQVAMSTLQVELTRSTGATAADPAGFGDGLLAGWNGLIVSLNALVIAFGFLLPWLAVAGVVVLIIWVIRRRRPHRDIVDHR
ncbi:DUF4349 domain-containing protein [Microbacterium sp. A196]|uniref:DUF4349 domain-containing protein n=1 Tax=unclassified Microbacterium TaxID=2609290 RepID=UPI003FCEFACE